MYALHSFVLGSRLAAALIASMMCLSWSPNLDPYVTPVASRDEYRVLSVVHPRRDLLQ